METAKNPKTPTEFHVPSINGSKPDIVATYTPSTGYFTANVSEKKEEVQKVSSSDFQIFAEEMREYAIITEETEDAMLEAHRAAEVIKSKPDREMSQTFSAGDKSRIHIRYLPEYDVYTAALLKLDKEGDFQRIELDKSNGIQSVEELHKLIPVEIPKHVVRNLILDREANISFKKNRGPKEPGPYIIPGNEPNLVVMVMYDKKKDAMTWMLIKDNEEVIEKSEDDVTSMTTGFGSFSSVDDLMDDIFSIGIVTATTENKMRKEIDNYRDWKNGIAPSTNITQESKIETAHGR